MPPRRSRAQYEPARLPLALTPLLGRARELEELMLLLRGTRLLSITGAGGSGKTRLALEIAHRIRATPADVIWVELAPIGDAELVARQILDAMGVRELAAEDVLQVVIDTVRDRTILFVLDNCEHLVDATAVVTQEILQSCPNATVLTTSRESLGITGEQTWLVPPLSEDDAVLLFLERARAVLPAFRAEEEVVRTICRRLDGIPLAIELAAARVKVLPIEEIAARLDDAFRLLTSGSRTAPRHRTIHETIDWSYRLLSAEEQALFRRLAIFSGSFTIGTVEAIFGKDALELVSALVDKSLVLSEGARYRLLDTVRQFAAEKLDESGEAAEYREKHARHFVAFAEKLEPLIFAGAVDRSALTRIDEELGNIRAVFDATDPELILRILYALRWYWFARGHFHEARRRINGVLPRAKDADPILRAKVLVAAGDAAVWQADWSSLRPSIDEAVETLRQTNDARALTSALRLLATAQAFAAGDHAGALATVDEAIEIARREGLDVNLALTLYWRGLIVQLHSDWGAARVAFEEAYDAGVALCNTVTIAHPLTALAHIALFQGHREEAIDSLRTALDLHTLNDDRWGLTQVVEGVGLVLLDGGDAETGTRLLAAAAAAWLHLGARPARGAAFEEEKSGRIREALGDERLRVVLASGAAMSYDTMLALARGSLAEVHAAGAAVVKVRALGRLEIERDGVQIEEAPRARELLLYLLCHRAGRTEEQIGAALWPDVDPARLRNNVHVTLHRLRMLLGHADWIAVEGEKYALDRKKGIELDAEVFEREVGIAMRARSADRLSHALELYRGTFFANATTGEWHLEIRARLRDLYARALDQLARLRVFENDYSKAAQAYRRLVQLDSLDEEAAAGLIDAMLKLGDRTGAVRAWERLAKMLKRELGVFPTIERPA